MRVSPDMQPVNYLILKGQHIVNTIKYQPTKCSPVYRKPHLLTNKFKESIIIVDFLIEFTC